MSSTSYTKPVHRLVFDGMVLTLFAPGDPQPVARADLAAPDTSRQRADLAASAKASPGLTVVLPEAEVWRGTVRLGSRTPWGRRAEALAEAEALSGIPRDALYLVVGKKAADGTSPVAAIRRQSVIDTLVFLDRTGLRATALTGAGDFPGFLAQPLFRIGGRDWPAEAVTFVTDLARRLPPVSRKHALAASGSAAALLLLGFLMSGGEDPVPAPVPVVTAPAVVPEVIFPVADAPEAAPVEAAPAVLIAPAAPRARPADLPAPPPVTERIDAALAPLPPALRPDGPADARPVTIASRTTPDVPSARLAAKPADLTLTVTPTARVRVAPALDATSAGIASLTPTSVETPAASLPAEAAPLIGAAEPQPSVASAVAEVAEPVSRTVSSTRPKARTATIPAEDIAETVRAALETAEAAEAASPTPPLATAAMIPAAPPEPRRPASVAPQPIAVRAAVLAASAVPPAKTVATPAAVPVAVAKPVAVARAAPAAKPAPVVQAPAPSTSRAASERTGLSRNDVSLLGVFGSPKDRYALLRLPNGSVKRVGTGESVQGVRVAAISSDAVRLSQGQRETVLRMPD